MHTLEMLNHALFLRINAAPGTRAWLIATATIAAGLAVGYARVFLGLHFPLDMAGSLGVAGASCAVVFPLWRRAGRRITQQIEGLYRLALARPIAWRLLRS